MADKLREIRAIHKSEPRFDPTNDTVGFRLHRHRGELLSIIDDLKRQVKNLNQKIKRLNAE